jgi:hypothetical protein
MSSLYYLLNKIFVGPRTKWNICVSVLNKMKFKTALMSLKEHLNMLGTKYVSQIKNFQYFDLNGF